MKQIGKNYYFYKLRKIALLLVVFGALNYTLSKFGYDFVDMIGFFTFMKRDYAEILMFVAGIFVLSDRSTWLPFLENTVLPCAVINKEPPKDATLEVVIQTTPNKKIVYWAANPTDEELEVWDAYGDYSNSGVTVSDKDGKAVCKIRHPSGYKLPNGSSLSPHIHYRECPSMTDAEGMMGPVRTVFNLKSN
jgi:hypothetical protein